MLHKGSIYFTLNSSPYENREKTLKGIKPGKKIKLGHYVSLLKRPNFDAADIKWFSWFWP